MTIGIRISASNGDLAVNDPGPEIHREVQSDILLQDPRTTGPVGYDLFVRKIVQSQERLIFGAVFDLDRGATHPHQRPVNGLYPNLMRKRQAFKQAIEIGRKIPYLYIIGGHRLRQSDRMLALGSFFQTEAELDGYVLGHCGSGHRVERLDAPGLRKALRLNRSRAHPGHTQNMKIFALFDLEGMGAGQREETILNLGSYLTEAPADERLVEVHQKIIKGHIVEGVRPVEGNHSLPNLVPGPVFWQRNRITPRIIIGITLVHAYGEGDVIRKNPDGAQGLPRLHLPSGRRAPRHRRFA